MALTTGQKDRLVKNVVESVFSFVGGAAGKTMLGGMLTPYVGGPLMQEAIGIGTATAVEIPLPVAAALSKVTGGNPSDIHRYLNEGIDASVKALTSSVAAQQQQDPNYQPTEADYARAVQRGMAVLQEESRRSDVLEAGAHKVIVNPEQKVFHDRQCPICTRSMQRKGKKGGPEETTTVLRDNYAERDVKWALENGYTPTTAPCCNISAQKVVQQLAETPTTLMIALTKLGQSSRDKYKELYEAADAKTQEKIAISGQVQKFTPSTLDLYLKTSANPETFLRQIAEPKEPDEASGITGFLKKLAQWAKGPDENDPELKAIRDRSQKQVKSLREQRAKTDRQTTALRNINNRK